MGTKPGHSPDGGVPLGTGSPDEPAHTLPAEPAQITKAQSAKAAAAQPRAGAHKRPGNEEPEPTLEDDLPSDGRDKKGEAMIRELPRQAGKKEK
ncbi:hypothetical protein PMI15_01440 [Polaromonas sp. CF318]|uniref:hypothetical protein n=1 Tax=Polaromonas sp. CF318 TaxID=1144318 RepID=UPI000271088F|nr:hypothetical protein [Polaromonas sp. CF318]EJL86226.1 hypothetical protein PMI15_01440 [Polaromonas sp. CF318]